MANRFWIGDGGSWSDTAHWSTTSGGSGGASVPTLTTANGYTEGVDDVIFDEKSFTLTGQTVTSGTSIYTKSFTSANCLYNPTLALTTGNLLRHHMAGNTDYSGVTLTFASGAQKVLFYGTGAVAINTGTNSFKSIEFQAPLSSATFTIQGTMTVAAGFILNHNFSSDFILTGATITTVSFSTSGAAQTTTNGTINISGSLQLGEGLLTSSGTVWNLPAGTSMQNLAGATSVVLGTGGTIAIDTATISGASSSDKITITNNSGSDQTISNSTLTNTVLNGSNGFKMVEVIDGGGNDWSGGGGGGGGPVRQYHVKIPPTYIALP